MARFSIAQDGVATDVHLEAQALVRAAISDAGAAIESVTSPSREQSLALTKLEEALMWAGRAIFAS